MNRSMTRRETTNSTGNLGSVVLILFKNGLTYTSLSTQSLSSLDPSSDYLAIAVKIKRASPIHLFNVYVPPIRSSFDSRPKSFLPFFLPSSSSTYIFGDFNSHHSSWDSHSPEDQSGKYLFDWLLSSDLLPINNPEHYTLLHRATGNRSYPDLSLVPAQIASKCTWQTLPDLGSDHLPISIAIPTSPIINSFHRLPSFNYNKARWDDYLTYIDTHCDLIFIQESHLSSDSTFRIPGYKTLQKNRFMTRRGTTNSTGNLGGGVLILVKNGLSYTSLSTQSLSSLDPSSDYLAIAVKIKGAAPIHLFNVYVPPIRSFSSDSRPKSFSPFLLPSSPTTYIFGDFNSHHSSWDSHSPEDHSGKYLFDWLLSSDLLPLNNPEHHTLLHRATGNRSSPDLSLVPARIASKCTWQTLPDLGLDYLPISITIPTSPYN